jgi:uncharacterized membrane protein YgcG
MKRIHLATVATILLATLLQTFFALVASAETVYFQNSPEAMPSFESPQNGLQYFVSDDGKSLMALPAGISLNAKYWKPVSGEELGELVGKIKQAAPGLTPLAGGQAFVLGNPPSYLDISGTTAKAYKAEAGGGAGGAGGGSSGGGGTQSGGKN